jgi:hypothetical protein
MGLGSGIRKKPIPDPGSRGQKGTGSRIRIRNTAFLNHGSGAWIRNKFFFRIPDLGANQLARTFLCIC